MPKIYSDFLQEDYKRRTRKLKRRVRRFPARHKKSRSILTDEAAFIIAI